MKRFLDKVTQLTILVTLCVMCVKPMSIQEQSYSTWDQRSFSIFTLTIDS